MSVMEDRSAERVVIVPCSGASARRMLRLRSSGSVRVRQAGEDLYVAVDQCAERAARAVARAVERKRPRRKAVAARKPALGG